MFKRNLELDKDTQELVKKIIRTTELLNHRVSQIEEWINSQRKVTKKLTQGKNNRNIWDIEVLWVKNIITLKVH